MIKAVFFDVDGTLLSHKTNSVPDSARRALDMLREKGILTFLATGRHISMLQRMQPLEGLRFDGIVYLIMLFIWSGDTAKEETFRNWAKAQLIVTAITLVMGIILAVVFGAAMADLAYYM